MQKTQRVIPLVIVAVYSGIVLALCRPGIAVFDKVLLAYAQCMVWIWVVVALCALALSVAEQYRMRTPGSGVTIMRNTVVHFVDSRWRHDRFAGLVLPFVCYVPLIASYNIFKALYLPSAGFWAGRYIARSERALLGGHDAWQVTHWLVSSPWASQVIDLFYHAGFFPMVFGIAACSFAKPGSQLAWRYLTSYLLVWSVQGNLIAYLLPAAGPAIRGIMHPGASSFTALNAILQSQSHYLHAHGAIGLSSVAIQHGLVAVFGHSDAALGGGISAMPSLHNGMAVLLACAAWSIGRRTGIAATLYALLIWFGSVHLGWHYALDGIVACILTVLAWQGVGRISVAFERRDAVAPPTVEEDCEAPLALAA